MSSQLQKGIEHRIELHSRTQELLGKLRTPSPVDEELLNRYQGIYEQIKKSTKIIPKSSIVDPTWGLAEKFIY